MKKALLIVCAVVCSVFYVAAQQYQDVVYLKNGSVVRGIILEQIPGKTIKIATDNGSQFIFTLAEVEKMTKELPVQQQSQQHVYQSQPQQPQYQQPIQSQPVAVAPVRAPKVKKVIDWTPRYKGEINIGYAIAGSKFDGEYYYEDSDGETEEAEFKNIKTVLSRPLFETVHGVEIGPYFFVGAGLGLQYYCGKTKDARELAISEETYDKAERWNAVMIPIFANVKFMYPVNDKFTPFLNLGLGGTIGCHSSLNYKDSYEESYYGETYSYNYSVKARGGFYCDFGAGFRYKALNFGVGLQHQVLKMVYKTEYNEDGESGDVKDTYKIPFNSFYVKIGVNF